jgi:multidrug efflux pump subunit AcrA (membrane-fusion protein)
MRFVSPLVKRGRYRLAAVAGAVVLIAGVLGLMLVRGSAAVPQYRTASATVGTIKQSLSLTGNLTPVAQSNLTFQVAGTVTAIDVTVGQTVTAGQVLATVDPTTLQTALTQAQANLVAAQAKQVADQSSSSSSNAAQQLATAQTSLANDQTAYTDTVAVNNQTIRNDQRAVTADQASVNADNQALAQAQARYNTDGCSGSSSATCQSDQQNLSAAQQQQAKDQQSLAAAQSALPTDQVRAQQSNDQAAARVAADRTALSNAGSASSSANSSASQAASTAQDSATVSQAQQAVTTAQTALSNATLTAPNGGQVAQINTAVGNSVSGSGTSGSSSAGSGAAASSSAGSSSSAAQFIILSPGSFQVTSTVSDSVVSEVAIGQNAVVTAAGTTNGLAATVTSVGEIATISSGVATFPVTVQITGSHPALRDGMSATVNVVINQVVGVLTVPTSAVHSNGTTTTVQVLKNGVPSTVVVTVGAADASRTQIISGLSAGDAVVIATVTSTVPSAASGNGAPRRTGAGGLGGGGGLAVPGG